MATPLVTAAPDERFSKLQSLPFIGVHLMALGVFFVPFRWVDLLVCVGLYYFRMWAITTGYHRYFSHRAFKTSRVFQFLLALFATTSAQKGVLWWAANHRHHHRESDTEKDIHSPIQRGFWWSHVLWILCPKYEQTKFDAIKDFARFPELRFLNKWHLLPPIALAAVLFLAGGFSMLLWGFFLSTTLLWHGTFTINSLSHVFGKRRYKTTDTSRNNWLLALLTCGEGWHNNHHYHQNTANAGWFWWEIDLSFYALKAFEKVGLVWDLRMPSDAVKYAHLKYSDADRLALQDPERVIRAKAAAGAVPASAPAIGVPAAAANMLSKPAEKMREAIAAATETLQQPAPAEP